MAYMGFISVDWAWRGHRSVSTEEGSSASPSSVGGYDSRGNRFMKLIQETLGRLDRSGPGVRSRGSVVGPADRRGAAEPSPLMLEQTAHGASRENAIKVLVLVCLGAVSAMVIARTGISWGRFGRASSSFGSAAWSATLVYGSFMYAVLLWRLWLWRRYRPMAAVADESLPSVTVVMPVFNEGALVAEAIRSVAASRYPAGRLELVIVDDGSTDDSWLHILRGARAVSDRIKVTTLRHVSNKGKRHALHLGFSRGRSEVFVTVDSDSLLHPNAICNGAAALVRDRRVGCVAGCVEVLNPRASLITRFLKCSFSLSFKFVRAYQNEFRGVFCTPGALSFYRAAFVREVADEWVSQRFLGQACTTGEDRSMTNLFLREGWLTAYQGNSKVFSKMPETFAGMCRMFLRWARSNIRETVVLFGFLFRQFRGAFLNTFRLNMLLATLSLVLPPIFVAGSLMLLVTRDGYALNQFLAVMVYSLSVAVIYYINERDTDWVWLIVYELVWVSCLWWIIPYAFISLRNTGWLTRSAGSESCRPFLAGPATAN